MSKNETKHTGALNERYIFRSSLIIALSSTVVGLSACAVPTPYREFQNVPPGKVFARNNLNIAAPNSEGWLLLRSDRSGMYFARRGSVPGDSIAAAVLIFDLPQTDSPEEFEAFIVKRAQSDLETDRFSTSKFTHQYTAARGYPCVQTENISEDRQAKTGPYKTEILTLQNEWLVCRHPVQTNIGFAVGYSYRGKNLEPDFQKEAHSFIEGIQVPNWP